MRGCNEPWDAELARRSKFGGVIATLDALRKEGGLYRLYVGFELVVSVVLLIFVSFIIVYSLAVLAVTLFDEFTGGVHLFEVAALKDTFGLILSILILVEFNHSIALAIRRRSGVLHVRVIILITIIVIARKLILIDYATTRIETWLGLGALSLSLGLLYWLLSNAAARRARGATADAENELG
jgi:uncharacterized membrane protein (DUF373 family)